MSVRPVDPHAVAIPRRSGLLPCLYVPIAARDRSSLELYVGRVVDTLGTRSEDAWLVESYDPPPRDPRLLIWALPGVAVLHASRQVWVHVDYRSYRRAYARAFPDAALGGSVLDHVMNRRLARIKGFAHVRLVPVDRAVNSSHGGLSEGWGVTYHQSECMLALNRASEARVQYADLVDIVKMLNMQGGGSFMEIVNDAQRLVDPP